MSLLHPRTTEPSQPKLPHKRRWLRIVGYTVGSLILFLVVVLLGGWYYTTTADFQRRVGSKVVSILEDSTGGKVELGHISFSLLHLAIEADNLVIHGTEGPGEAPYISIARLFVRVKINTFLAQGAAGGPKSHVGLNYLRAEQPHIHLIIDKDGHTNQPVPKHPTPPSPEPVQDTLLDLQAEKVELADGLAVLNDRAIPFDLAASNLNAEVHYISSTDRYAATIDLANLQTKMAKQPDVQSKLHLTAEIGRDIAQLKSFDFETGANTHLTADALVNHFANPEWQADVDGSIDVHQLGLLADIDGLTGGRVDLILRGRNCQVSPVVAQKRPKIFRRRTAPATDKVLPPDPDCKAGYLLVGNVKLHSVGYRNEYVALHDVNGGATLHITPTELLFNALSGYLPGGGSAEGDLRITNWLGEVPSNAPATSATTVAAATTANTTAKGLGAAPPVQSLTVAPVAHAEAHLVVKVNHIPLRTIMDITDPSQADLGLDTSITGPVTVDWGGPATSIADTVQVEADLQFIPTGQTRSRAITNLPVSGEVKAHYDGKPEIVRIAALNLNTPATNITASGALGVNEGDPLTALKLNVAAHDLGEFDGVLQSLGFENDGKKGSAALPVVLHGQLNFNGSASGPIRGLDIKGYLAADNMEVKLGSVTDTLIDSVVADAEYSPTGLAVASSTIKRQTAVLNVAGSFKPRREVSRRHVVSYVWDGGTAVNASVKLVNAQTTDLLQITGQQNKVDLTGVANIDVHAVGTLDNLTGAGNISLTGGEAYGENFQTISVDAAIAGQQITASRILIAAHGMTINGNGGYNLTSKRIQAHIAGNNLVLSKFDTVKKQNLNADGTLNLNADADGTLEEPNLRAMFSLANITVQGKPIGELQATAHSTGSDVFYDLHSTLVGAQLAANGQTSLKGDYETQAKLTLSGLDIAKPLALFSTSSFNGTSNIGGTITVSGPAAQPTKLMGTAEFTPVEAKVQGIDLKSAAPFHATLSDGTIAIDELHITGQDTDLRIGGNAKVLGDLDPKGGAMNLTATGSISMALAHTFDPDLITSGKVTFNITADGRLKDPKLSGGVQFVNVNLAIDGIPNGLSAMNGNLVFAQNRLDVQDLTAMTGGGKLTIGGSLLYQNGGIVYDLNAHGDTVRIRYAGLSATATASFKLQGGPQAAILSGNILITRFGVGADVDFAAFAGTGGVSLPPDPNSAPNRIQLDIRVTSAPQLDFQNSYAKLAGNVDLNIRGTAAVPSILGKIQITDGSATFAGTKYELQRGTIYFTNPVRIDPIIDLDATARVENYDITISLHGTTTSLKPTYRSSPPLTEADIFNLLALGRTQEEAQIYQEQQVQAGTDPTTSALLGGALNATVSSRVGKIFGAGSVKIDPAFVGTLGNSSARITVQEPLSKQLTLVFATNVNESAQQLIQVQYQITQDTSLVATRDESGVFSIVYKIRKRYR